MTFPATLTDKNRVKHISVVCLCPSGSVPREVHRHRVLAAVLQTHPEQAAGPQRPGVHRPGVLQLAHVDQVSSWRGVWKPVYTFTPSSAALRLAINTNTRVLQSITFFFLPGFLKEFLCFF